MERFYHCTNANGEYQGIQRMGPETISEVQRWGWKLVQVYNQNVGAWHNQAATRRAE